MSEQRHKLPTFLLISLCGSMLLFLIYVAPCFGQFFREGPGFGHCVEWHLPFLRPGTSVWIAAAVVASVAGAGWWMADARSARRGLLGALPGLGFTLVVRLLVEGGARTLYSALGIGLAILGLALGGAIPARHSAPDPSKVGEAGDVTQPLGGCALVSIGVLVWFTTFILSFSMAGGVVHDVMVGDRCDGKPWETFCGFESIPVTVAVSFLLAVVVMVVVLGMLTRRHDRGTGQ